MLFLTGVPRSVTIIICTTSIRVLAIGKEALEQR